MQLAFCPAAAAAPCKLRLCKTRGNRALLGKGRAVLHLGNRTQPARIALGRNSQSSLVGVASSKWHLLCACISSKNVDTNTKELRQQEEQYLYTHSEPHIVNHNTYHCAGQLNLKL